MTALARLPAATSDDLHAAWLASSAAWDVMFDHYAALDAQDFARNMAINARECAAILDAADAAEGDL